MPARNDASSEATWAMDKIVVLTTTDSQRVQKSSNDSGPAT